MPEIDTDKIVDALIGKLEQDIAAIIQNFKAQILDRLKSAVEKGDQLDIATALTNEVRRIRRLTGNIAELFEESPGADYKTLDRLIDLMKNPTNDDLRMVIAYLQERMHFTQQQIAEDIGSTQAYVSNFLRGKYPMRKPILRAKMIARLRQILEEMRGGSENTPAK